MSHGTWQHLAHPAPSFYSQQFDMQATGHLITESLVLSIWFDPFRLLDKACFERAFADSFNPFTATGTSYNVRDKALSTCFTGCCANSCLNFSSSRILGSSNKVLKSSISGPLNLFPKLFLEGNCAKCIFVGSERVNDKNWFTQARATGWHAQWGTLILWTLTSSSLATAGSRSVKVASISILPGAHLHI